MSEPMETQAPMPEPVVEAPRAETAVGTTPTELVGAESSSSKPMPSLDALIAQGTAQYSLKNYSAAADLYAQASDIQAELNGEMSPKNAEILYLYGRSLYQVGVSKSDVLGA